jgi:hypothetical protein
MRAVLVLAALLALCGSALADTPADAVRFFYTPPQFEPDPTFRNRFADPAKAVFDSNDKISQTDEIGCIDFNLAADGQDFDDAEIVRTLAFVWNDPFLLDDQLSEDERMIRDAAAAFAADKLMPRIENAYMNEKTDPAIFREMGEAGLLGITMPEEYGGLGAGYVAYGLVAREVERVDSGYRSMMSVQSSLVMYPIHAYGSEEQRKKYLPKLASRRMDRLLRPDRTGCRLRSGRHEDPRREDGERLSPERLEDVDFQRADRRRFCGVGEIGGAWQRDRGFVLEKGMKGLSAPKIDGKLSRCAPRSPARSCWTMSRSARMRCCRTCRVSRDRSAA